MAVAVVAPAVCHGGGGGFGVIWCWRDRRSVGRTREEPIPPWGNYCFWAELLCPFPPSPSFPLLFSSSFKSSGRIGRWIDPKVQLGIFQVQSTRLKVGPRSHAMFCPGPSHSQHQLMSRLLHFSKLISTLSTLKVL